MINLWRFISRFNAFFLLIIYFSISLIMLIKNNDFQRASTFNTSNQIIGSIYSKVNDINKYLRLSIVNDSLAQENLTLHNQLKSSFFNDSLVIKKVNDTINRIQYEYIVAEVVNKSITSRNNYITINRGSKHGIKKGMGVIGSNGVVGIVWNVSENFSSIQSILHEDTKITSSIEGTPYFGPLIWDGDDPNIVTLTDIPNQLNLKKNARVVTSGLGVIFPPGILIGTVLKSGVKGGGSFLDISVKLATNFYALQYVYVIKNNFQKEQENLELQNKESVNE
ncbi:MAG: rod shape-determining protein MreC [Bacteroidetes bacterium]|nr:rod shape-determining protein MreC [Bacteroidota bacterium]MBU1373332.1 rod shape-determining protein MreC [Bacteroidota bacterium]MBU1484423.1 rod shape-determining protein MreC [Bacteroidota bacterium]MBU1762217.1 rod shape-determining protein MreC [Bacteroidota bacterium]MBU2046992.1 rod shape-determining protein MreC [Bacteroidota bacterium]